MLARRILPLLAPAASRRSYSYFSKPGGGGRFFNSSKPHRVPTRSSNSATKPAPTATVPGTSNIAASQGDGEKPSNAIVESTNIPAGTAQSEPRDESGVSSVTSSPSLSPSQPSTSTSALSHPTPALPAVHLHSFFSQHRPLLLLDQPVATLFQSTQHSHATSGADASTEQSQVNSEVPSYGMDDSEVDADTARVLARAMVLQRVQSNREWNRVMVKLGLETEEAVIEMDSVKRKRRKKITKHKYKKRRKLQRAERRRLGK